MEIVNLIKSLQNVGLYMCVIIVLLTKIIFAFKLYKDIFFLEEENLENLPWYINLPVVCAPDLIALLTKKNHNIMHGQAV